MSAITNRTRIYEIGDYIVHRHTAPDRRRILDLGCGDGARSLALAARRFNRVTGVDRSENLLQIARNQASRRNLAITFLCTDPAATGLDAGSFDEVLIMGGLFGHGKTPRADVELLLEAQRLLSPGGSLRLSFSDGVWLQKHFEAESVESVFGGFICRHRVLLDHGCRLKTEITSAGEELGARNFKTEQEWIYTARDVSDLLYRLGFRAIAYEEDSRPFWSTAPVRTVHCIVPPGNRPRLQLASG